MPSQSRSARIASTNRSSLRSLSVSSILSTKRPPFCRAHNQLCSAVRMLPTCSRPVGEGAKRVTTLISRAYARGASRAMPPSCHRPVALRGRLDRRGATHMKLMAGNSNLPLARDIAAYLELPLTDALVRRFADEEIFVEILENVRGEDVFILQSTG